MKYVGRRVDLHERRGRCVVLGAEVCFHPVQTYRSSRRTNNGRPTKASLACPCYWQNFGEKGDTIMKKIAAIFALAIAFTTGMAVVTVVAAIV